jgi:hypothetical protein
MGVRPPEFVIDGGAQRHGRRFDDAIVDDDRFAVRVVAGHYAAYVHRELSSLRGGS